MSTLDLLDDSFPHGTPDGYRQGCRSAACPAVIPCRTVHSRYSGDYSFARLIDAGVPLAEILERDAAERANARQGDRAAAREARRAADTPAKRTPSRKAPPTPRAKRKPAPGRDVDEYQRALEQRSDEQRPLADRAPPAAGGARPHHRAARGGDDRHGSRPVPRRRDRASPAAGHPATCSSSRRARGTRRAAPFPAD